MEELLIKDYNILWEVLLFTVGTGSFFLSLLHGNNQRIIFIFFTIFYYFYNGFGIGFVDGVYHDYFMFYIIFYLVFGFSYFIFLKILLSESRVFRRNVIGTLDKISKKKMLIRLIIIGYISTKLFDLIYPEFKLQLIISPPKPDIATQFFQSVKDSLEGKFNPLTKIVDNISFLLYPFYLMALANYRNKLGKLAIFVFLPLYFHYCSISYINRGAMLEALILLSSVIWFYNKKIRKKLLIVGLVVLPLIPILLFQYSALRKGGTRDSLSVKTAVVGILNVETEMPKFSKKVIESEKQINLKYYYLWMFTLPIPKVIIGAVPVVSAGAEMSEIILGVKQGQKGYYALLAGLLTESVYTYGTRFYFLHAIMLAFLMAFATRFTEHNPYLYPVFVIYIILFSYTLNRAGVASAIPVFINKFLLLYALLFGIYGFNRLGLRKLLKRE